MKKKLLALCLVGGLLSVCLTGCGKKTVEGLFTDSQASMKKMQTAEVGVNLDISCDLTSGDTTATFGMGGDFKVDVENEKGAYVDGSIVVEALGSKVTQGVKSYVDISGDKVLTYTYDEESDSWNKSESDKETDEVKNDLTNMDFSAIYNKLALADKVEDLDGNKVYHVSGTINGDDLKAALESMKDVLGDDFDTSKLDDVDMSKVNVATDFYFDSKTSMIRKAVFDLSATDFKSLLGDSSDDSEDDMSMKFNAFTFTMTFDEAKDYKFEIPSDVTGSSVDAEDVVE